MYWCKAALLPFLLLLTACALVAPPEPFVPAQRDFADRLRWRDFAGAARHMAPEEQDDFRRRFAELTDLNIIEVRLDSADFTADGKRVNTWNSIEYFLLPSATVKTFRFEQAWELAGGDRWHAGAWQIATPFPAFPGEVLKSDKAKQAPF